MSPAARLNAAVLVARFSSWMAAEVFAPEVRSTVHATRGPMLEPPAVKATLAVWLPEPDPVAAKVVLPQPVVVTAPSVPKVKPGRTTLNRSVVAMAALSVKA